MMDRALSDHISKKFSELCERVSAHPAPPEQGAIGFLREWFNREYSIALHSYRSFLSEIRIQQRQEEEEKEEDT